MWEFAIIIAYTATVIGILVGGARLLGRYLEKRGEPSGSRDISGISAASALDASHDGVGGDGGD